MIKRSLTLIATLLLALSLWSATNPINGLLERIDPGASKRFVTRVEPSNTDFFELSQRGDKVMVTANSYVNLAVGINWYLKNYANIHLSWNGMKAKLPDVLPPVPQPERHESTLPLRYDFNYCTFSYTMPFWDWERWQQEIDWMALHGINMPLAAVGMEVPWKNMLLGLGYSKEEVNEFIAGPAFTAWWAMNNLEGWGGPNPDSWYERQEGLQKQILKRMKEYGMTPVLPGFYGMMPHNADTKLGLELTQGGTWNGYQRPAILSATDPRFAELASRYYDEQKKLYGQAKYYSMDPFHECADPEGFDFKAAGQAVRDAMKAANPDAVWVLQGWSENPRKAMLDGLNPGDIIVLDLFSECRPMWGMHSLWERPEGFGPHGWIFCMLENFGGNIGLHGRMDQLLENFYATKTDPKAEHIQGWGFTMEGSETNPVMYELMSELPWMDQKPDKGEWLDQYTQVRYGSQDTILQKAWRVLGNSIYNCPRGNNQQGTTESIFCSRPKTTLDNYQASTWSKMSNYYEPQATEEAARLMLSVADKYRGNNNFEYDLVDVVRQALSDRGRVIYNRAMADFKSHDMEALEKDSREFLRLIELQDSLLATRPEFRVGTYTERARRAGDTPEEKDLYEWNQRVQYTTWGQRECADKGRLHDYAHREWNGLLKDFYLPRWKAFFEVLKRSQYGQPIEQLDYYAMEEPWTLDHTPYAAEGQGDPVDVARGVFEEAFSR